MAIIAALALALAVAPAQAPALDLHGVQLGMSLGRFKQLRPGAACSVLSWRSPPETACEEEYETARLPFETEVADMNYSFSSSGILYEISFGADNLNSEAFKSHLIGRLGTPSSVEDSRTYWEQSAGTSVIFNDDCDEDYMCLNYRLQAVADEVAASHKRR